MDAVLLQIFVEVDLLGHHRLALGDGFGILLTANLQDGLACIISGATPVYLAAVLDHAGLERFQIQVQVFKDMVLQVASFIAQPIELRHAGDS